MTPASAPDPDRPLVVPLIAGVLALVGAFLSLMSLFTDYYETGVPYRQVPAARWFFLLFVVAAIAAGVLLVAQRHTQLIGAAALGAIAVTFVGARGLSIYYVSRAGDPSPAGAGFWLDLLGFLLIVVAAVFATVGVLAVDRSARRLSFTRNRNRLALIGGVIGFVIAVGYGLNTTRVNADPVAGTLDTPQGSPFIPSARSLWTQLLVVLALVLLPPLIAFVSRRVAIGFTIGLMAFVVAETFSRVLTSYGKVQGVDSGRDAIEGTWVFLVGGLALAAVIAVRLMTVPDESQRKAESRESARAA
jgi:hypothetical protein